MAAAYYIIRSLFTLVLTRLPLPSRWLKLRTHLVILPIVPSLSDAHPFFVVVHPLKDVYFDYQSVIYLAITRGERKMFLREVYFVQTSFVDSKNFSTALSLLLLFPSHLRCL